MRTFIVAALVALCAVAYADVIERMIALEAGQSIVLSEEVPWPVVSAWAKFDRPVKIGDVMATEVSFYEGFSQRVYGPVVITLHYGNPWPDQIATDSVSTPDAIQ